MSFTFYLLKRFLLVSHLNHILHFVVLCSINSKEKRVENVLNLLKFVKYAILICIDLAGCQRRRRRVRSAVPSNHGDDHPDGAADRRVRQGPAWLLQDIAA